MRRPKEFLVLGVAAIAVLGMCVFFAFQTLTEQRLSESRAQVKRPAAMTFYEELHAPDGEDSSGQKDPALDPAPEHTAPEREYAEETLARYAKLSAWMKERPEDLRDWNDLGRDVLSKHRRELSADERMRLEAFSSANQDLIRELRELAGRGGPVYPLHFTGGFHVEMPHLAQMRDFTRLLCADATAKALNGDYGGATEDLIAGMKLAVAIAGEPTLISQFSGIAMSGIVYEAFQRTFDRGELPHALAQELVRQAARSDGREAFADSLLGEQYMGLDVFSQLQQSGWLTGFDIAQDASEFSSRGGTAGLPLFLYASPLARPWQNMDELAYAEAMGSLADVTRLPYYEARPLLAELEGDIQNLPRTRVLSRDLLPTLTWAARAQARHEAQLDILQIGILLEQRYTQHGEYPATLDAIVGDLGGGVPVDPFTGESYHYEPRGDTFLLYSVGLNLADDGGSQVYRDDGRQNVLEGDIVWRAEKRQPIKVASQSN